MKKLNKYIDAYISLIDSGKFFYKPFFWIYTLAAVASLVIPVILFVMLLNEGVFSAPSKIIAVSLLNWLFIAFAGWVAFKIWWDRKNKVHDITKRSMEFVAIPIFSHLIQTVGESLGVVIAITGLGKHLISTIFFGATSVFIAPGLYLPSIAFIVIMPILGFLVVVFFRVFAESLKALVTIAINTRK
jgi:hypothetical protein